MVAGSRRGLASQPALFEVVSSLQCGGDEVNMLAVIEPFYRLSLATKYSFHAEMVVNNELSPLTPLGEESLNRDNCQD